MRIVDKLLEDGEYFKEIIEKDTIYLHHTAGSHRPDWSIDGWEKDKSKSGGLLAVATAYVIGGLSTRDRNGDFDGVIYRAFDDKYWAHHLGTTYPNNKVLNQKSIGIEICNYGPCKKTKDGKFLNYVNSEVPADMVEELPEEFRGYTHYHKYTEKQLIALKELMLDIKKRHPKVNLQAGIRDFLTSGFGAFGMNQGAAKGIPGVWSHTNVIAGKFDVWPQKQLIELIKTV